MHIIHLQKLTSEHIDVFYAKLLSQGKSPKSIKDIHGILHVALKYAVKKKRIARNVADDVDLPRMERYRGQVLDMEQARRLLAVARESRYETLLTVALATGMRRGELLALRWRDIQFETRSLHIQRTVYRVKGVGYVESEPKTNRGRRNIMLPQFAIVALKQHHAQQLDARAQAGPLWMDRDLVFCNMTGDFLYPDNVSADFKRLVEKAGLPPMRLHDLRHSAATILLAMGVHPKVVQEILGHAQISMTMDTYSHMLPTMQREAMEGLDNLFGKEKFMAYTPQPGDWRVEEVEDDGKKYWLFWQWRQEAWEFSERINDEIEAGNFVEGMNLAGESGNYIYWHPMR